MFYMALSLAFTAGGVILLYLLWHASPTTGQTLNAVTFRLVLSSLPLGATHVDTAMWIVLALEVGLLLVAANTGRSEEHTSELQSLMRISYAVFCLKKKKNNTNNVHIKHDLSKDRPENK